MHLYKTLKGLLLVHRGESYLLTEDWDQLVNQSKLREHLLHLTATSRILEKGKHEELLSNYLLPPIGSQEVWAAGVTYMRSRDARMEESKDAGAADFYEKVYEAARPELFFKSLPERVAGHLQDVRIRKDSSWNVPEPELTLFINSEGQIKGYTIGNDMSSRSIEGENPLYLPQAKMYDKSAALGPCLHIPQTPLSGETSIMLTINRNNKEVFNGSVQLNRMKRKFPELAEFLYRETSFPKGCYLMTGTGIVPPDNFTLQEGDVVTIRIDGIGELINTVTKKS